MKVWHGFCGKFSRLDLDCWTHLTFYCEFVILHRRKNTVLIRSWSQLSEPLVPAYFEVACKKWGNFNTMTRGDCCCPSVLLMLHSNVLLLDTHMSLCVWEFFRTSVAIGDWLHTPTHTSFAWLDMRHLVTALLTVKNRSQNNKRVSRNPKFKMGGTSLDFHELKLSIKQTHTHTHNKDKTELNMWALSFGLTGTCIIFLALYFNNKKLSEVLISPIRQILARVVVFR